MRMVPILGLWGRFNELTRMKYLGQCLVHTNVHTHTHTQNNNTPYVLVAILSLNFPSFCCHHLFLFLPLPLPFLLSLFPLLSLLPLLPLLLFFCLFSSLLIPTSCYQALQSVGGMTCSSGSSQFGSQFVQIKGGTWSWTQENTEKFWGFGLEETLSSNWEIKKTFVENVTL